MNPRRVLILARAWRCGQFFEINGKWDNDPFNHAVLFTLAFSWLSAIVGVIAKSVEGVQWLSFIFVFPLTFASSAFVLAEKYDPCSMGFC